MIQKPKTAYLSMALLAMMLGMAGPAHSQMTAAQQREYERTRQRHLESLIPKTQAERDAAWREYDQLEDAAAKANAERREREGKKADPAPPQAKPKPRPSSQQSSIPRVYFAHAVRNESNSCKEARAVVSAKAAIPISQFKCSCLETQFVVNAANTHSFVASECVGQFDFDPKKHTLSLNSTYDTPAWHLRFSLTPLEPLSKAILKQ